MDVVHKLRLAQQAAEDGHFEEALQGYIWYHHNALSYQPSQSGVRLSFALSYWLELAEVYPPALTALKDIRDQKTKRLVEGELDRSLFGDVSSINKRLKESLQTYQLFLQLVESAPDFADACADIARPVLIEQSDFPLARHFIKDPEAKIKSWARKLSQVCDYYATQPPTPAPRTEALVSNYARNVGQILHILASVGETEAVARLEIMAVECIESVMAKEEVRRHVATHRFSV
jgi:hypothetical protein